MTKKRLLITGANGRIGKLLQQALHSDYELRLTDLNECETTYSHDIHTQDILQPNGLTELMQNIDCVIHLAGIVDELPDAAKTLQTNILGTLNVLEAAKTAGVSRFIFASSIHSVGFYPRSQTLTRLEVPRPSSYYGVSKVAGEALVSLYADKYGISGICLRINTFKPKPQDSRELVTWLSENDAVELFRAAIEAPAEVHFEIIYGISNNSQKKLSNEGASFTFNPQDNAERYLDEISQEVGSVAKHFHGGPFTERFFAGDLQKTLNHTLGQLKKT